jgi:mRNA-degrading endonuclease RelE of RelBE toxin-antitoxin system
MMKRVLKISPLVEKQLLALNQTDREKLKTILDELINNPTLISDSQPLAPDVSGLYMRWLEGDICLIFTLDDSTLSCEVLMTQHLCETYQITLSEAKYFASLTDEQKKNEATAQQINHEARSNPQSPYAGKYVGLLDGKVVAVADTLDEVVDALAEIDPDPERGMVFDASADYNQTDYIWRID